MAPGGHLGDKIKNFRKLDYPVFQLRVSGFSMELTVFPIGLTGFPMGLTGSPIGLPIGLTNFPVCKIEHSSKDTLVLLLKTSSEASTV